MAASTTVLADATGRAVATGAACAALRRSLVAIVAASGRSGRRLAGATVAPRSAGQRARRSGHPGLAIVIDRRAKGKTGRERQR
jgi:hypothetical protein